MQAESKEGLFKNKDRVNIPLISLHRGYIKIKLKRIVNNSVTRWAIKELSRIGMILNVNPHTNMTLFKINLFQYCMQ
jgi:hypothetical protein